MRTSRETCSPGSAMPTSVADCPFCKIVREDDRNAREVYRDESVVAFFPLEPATLGHTLVVPRQHMADIWCLDEEIAAHLARVTVRLSKVVLRVLHPEGLNVLQSNGQVAEQTVPHLHVHVVPRWAGDAIGPIWPQGNKFSDAQKDATWTRLRDACEEGGWTTSEQPERP